MSHLTRDRREGYTRFVHRSMLAFFCVILVGHIGRDFSSGRGLTSALLGRHIGNAIFWLVWFQMLAVLGTPHSSPCSSCQSPSASSSRSSRS